MATCELCGKTGTDVNRVPVEGAQVKACTACANESTDTDSTSQEQRKETGNRSRESVDTGPTLVPDYGQRVRQAREDENLSQEELAAALNMKESVLSRVENKELTPHQELAQTLEQELGIVLYQEMPAGNTRDTGGTEHEENAATIGDVADIDTA